MSSIRIGQLTDIHVGDFADLRARDFATKRALGWFNYERGRRAEYDRQVLDAAIARMIEARPDLVVVSGDLTNLALPSELRAARAVLEPIAAAGLRLAVIPGNHDYYLRTSTEGAFERTFADWQKDDAGARPADRSRYPLLYRLGHTSVVLCNSGIATPPAMAFGRLGADQLARLDTMLGGERRAGQRLVVGVHHHATRAPHKRLEIHRGLRDVEALRSLLRRHGVSLVFHGHNHYLHVRRLSGAPDSIICGLSSSTTNRQDLAARRGMVGLYTIPERGLPGIETASWDGARLGPWEGLDLAAIPED